MEPLSILISGLPPRRSCCSPSDASPAALRCSTSLSLQLADRSLLASPSHLQETVAQACGIPADRFWLQHEGRICLPTNSAAEEEIDSLSSALSACALSDSASAVAPLLYRFMLRGALLGGKGGFGALLRSSTTKVGAKKTSNFSASRDLSGRRMRHVEAEEAIAKWNSEHHEPVKPAGTNTRKENQRNVALLPTRLCPPCSLSVPRRLFSSLLFVQS